MALGRERESPPEDHPLSSMGTLIARNKLYEEFYKEFHSSPYTGFTDMLLFPRDEQGNIISDDYKLNNKP